MSDANINTELARRRTGMAFQRTRMAADRTLMAVIRTALSLTGFGFTIYQFFGKLKDAGVIEGSVHAPHNFGLALVWLGLGMLVVGIVYHVQFMLSLRAVRADMKTEGLIHGETPFPTSLTLIVAIAMLVIAAVVIVTMF